MHDSIVYRSNALRCRTTCMHTAAMTPGSSAQSVCEGGNCLVALLAESCMLFGTVQRPCSQPLVPAACMLLPPCWSPAVPIPPQHRDPLCGDDGTPPAAEDNAAETPGRTPAALSCAGTVMYRGKWRPSGGATQLGTAAVSAPAHEAAGTMHGFASELGWCRSVRVRCACLVGQGRGVW